MNHNRRLKRLFSGPNDTCLLVPMDHGPWLGPIEGIKEPRDITEKVISGGATGLLVTPGFAETIKPVLTPDVGLALRTSITLGASEEAQQETPVASVETALRLDADAVAVSIFFGRGAETDVMEYLGELTEKAHRYDIPVLAEMMPTGDEQYDAESIEHVARIGMEFGGDIVKTNYCGDPADFSEITTSVQRPVIVAGGPKSESGSSLENLVSGAVEGGAAGVAIGRRVWQSDDPEATVRQISNLLSSS